MVQKNNNVAYIIENNIKVSEVEILNKIGGFCTVRIKGKQGAIRLRSSRVFETEEDANKRLQEIVNGNYSNIKQSDGYVDVFEGKRNNRNPHL